MLNDHTDREKCCFCHKDAQNPLIEMRRYAAEKSETVSIETHKIVFVTSGSIHIRTEHTGAEREIREGEFIFIPMSVRLNYRALTDTSLMIVRITVNVPECHIFRRHKASLPSQRDALYTLSINEPLKHFVDGLDIALSDGFSCSLYSEAKISELLFLLHSYYTEQECADFFSHIATPDMGFSEFVRTNFMKYATIAELSGALGMTAGHFARQFRNVFGTTPREWIARKKARLIYQDICQSNKTLKQIAYEYDFTLQSNFTRYCRKTFGKTPCDIRKNLSLSTSKKAAS